MPIIKSAKKRVRLAHKAATRNIKTKRSLKRALKNFSGATKSQKSKAQSEVHSQLDKAVKKGVMHKNKAARKKRQLAKQIKDGGIKPAAGSSKKTTAKKSAAKKPASKKSSTAKKTTTAKKPAAKKTTAKKTTRAKSPGPKK